MLWALLIHCLWYPKKTIRKTFCVSFFEKKVMKIHEVSYDLSLDIFQLIFNCCFAQHPPQVWNQLKQKCCGGCVLAVAWLRDASYDLLRLFKATSSTSLGTHYISTNFNTNHILLCLWTIWCKNWPLLIIFTCHFLHTTKLNNKTSEAECPMPRLLPIECHVVLRWGHVDVSSDGGIQWEYVYIYIYLYKYIYNIYSPEI